MNRNTKYLAERKIMEKNLSLLKTKIIGMACQASFPDSGYFYSQKQRHLDRLYDQLEKTVPSRIFKPYVAKAVAESNRLEQEYHDIENGMNGYSPAEMDRMMAHC